MPTTERILEESDSERQQLPGKLRGRRHPSIWKAEPARALRGATPPFCQLAAPPTGRTRAAAGLASRCACAEGGPPLLVGGASAPRQSATRGAARVCAVLRGRLLHSWLFLTRCHAPARSQPFLIRDASNHYIFNFSTEDVRFLSLPCTGGRGGR
jgi:hypothetical protein